MRAKTKIKQLEYDLALARDEAKRYKGEYLHYKALLDDVKRASRTGLCRGTWCAVCEHSYRYPENSDLHGLCVCRFSPCVEFKNSLLEE